MNLLKSFYLDRRLFIMMGAEIVLFVFAYFFPFLFPIARGALLVLVSLVLLEAILLYARGKVGAHRELPDRFSNGDDNLVRLRIENGYRFPLNVTVIDELPTQLQIRDMEFDMTLGAREEGAIVYMIHPVKRGEYSFGAMNVYASTPLRLVRRRYRFAADEMVPVYPSYLQMRRYELLAHTNRLEEVGVKKVRRIGRTIEFDQIRDYVGGDDYRTINWKATARRASLMVNQFQDERSQPVYSIIDKGRAMKMPFEGMTLLDYAINASLVVSNIAMIKGDRAGLVTFDEKMGTVLAADRRPAQMQKILELLYNQKTNYLEPNYELLYATVRRKINTRSLILLYTNFETLSSLERQLPYLRGIARSHLLVVVFFENTELRTLLDTPAKSTEGIYLKAIAEKFQFEKRQIVKELGRYGIHAILTPPKNLTVDALNKYLEIKARRLI